MAELDDVIHQPLRLRIMAALNALPNSVGLEFSKLKKLTGATDGNLGAHIETLAKAGYVRVDKAFVGKKPQTTVTQAQPVAAPSPAMSRPCRRSSREERGRNDGVWIIPCRGPETRATDTPCTSFCSVPAAANMLSPGRSPPRRW